MKISINKNKIKYLMLIIILLSVNISIYSQDTQCDTLFCEGVDLFNHGEYIEALYKFQCCYDIDKNNDNLNILIANREKFLNMGIPLPKIN